MISCFDTVLSVTSMLQLLSFNLFRNSQSPTHIYCGATNVTTDNITEKPCELHCGSILSQYVYHCLSNQLSTIQYAVLENMLVYNRAHHIYIFS